MLQTVKGFDFLELDEKEYTKTLDKTLGIILRQGARVYLRTWLSHGGGVPVETGMARAAFHELATQLGENISATVPIRSPYLSQLEGGEQSISFGEDKTFVEIIDKNFVYSFVWSTSTIHFFNSAFYNGGFIPGDVIIELAEQNMEDFINNELERRFVSPDAFIRLTKS